MASIVDDEWIKEATNRLNKICADAEDIQYDMRNVELQMNDYRNQLDNLINDAQHVLESIEQLPREENKEGEEKKDDL